ncbi:MAG: hypothetical protein HRT71_19235 [Flavobacteriales bacterium]|nr:hypothetical protein [Flavobacteriales bacterium]
MYKKIIFIFILALSSSLIHNDLMAQAEDSTIVKKKREHSPKAAAIMSGVLPGLGQIYNKKYLKPPIIYAGFGVLIHFANVNNTDYQNYKLAYSDRLAGITCDPNESDYCDDTIDQLRALKDQSRQLRDLDFILMAGLYILNIVDATVDAHLFDFDMSDDLSLKLNFGIDTYQTKTTLMPQLNLSIKL